MFDMVCAQKKSHGDHDHVVRSGMRVTHVQVGMPGYRPDTMHPGLDMQAVGSDAAASAPEEGVVHGVVACDRWEETQVSVGEALAHEKRVSRQQRLDTLEARLEICLGCIICPLLCGKAGPAG
jgi:hypothetical protein